MRLRRPCLEERYCRGTMVPDSWAEGRRAEAAADRAQHQLSLYVCEYDAWRKAR